RWHVCHRCHATCRCGTLLTPAVHGEEAPEAWVVGGQGHDPETEGRPLPPGAARVAGGRELVAEEPGAHPARRGVGEGVRRQQGERTGVVVHQLRVRSEEHTSELQSRGHLVCRLLLEKKNNQTSWWT